MQDPLSHPPECPHQETASPSETGHGEGIAAEQVDDRRGRCLPDSFTILLLATFTTAVTYTTLHHVMWRGESHVWLIGQGKETLGDLIRQLGYEGHPIAWAFCCWALSKLGVGLLGLKLF